MSSRARNVTLGVGAAGVVSLLALLPYRSGSTIDSSRTLSSDPSGVASARIDLVQEGASAEPADASSAASDETRTGAGVVVARTWTIHGVVRAPPHGDASSLRGVTGARVSFEGDGQRTHIGLTDDRGCYSVEGLGAGAWSVRVMHPRYPVDRRTLVLDAEPIVREMDFDLVSKAPFVLRARLSGWEAFDIVGVERDALRNELVNRLGASMEFSVEDPKNGLTIVDTERVDGFRGFGHGVNLEERANGDLDCWKRIDPKDAVGPAEIAVDFRSERLEQREIAELEGEHVFEIPVRRVVDRFGALRLRVASDGQRAGALSLTSPDTHAKAGADGSVLFPLINVGTHVLIVATEDEQRMQIVRTSIRSGELTDLGTIELAESGSLEVAVSATLPDHRRLECGLLAIAEDDDGRQRLVRCQIDAFDAAKRMCVFRRVPPGRYVIRVVDPWRRVGSSDVEMVVESGSKQTLEVRVVPVRVVELQTEAEVIEWLDASRRVVDVGAVVALVPGRYTAHVRRLDGTSTDVVVDVGGEDILRKLDVGR